LVTNSGLITNFQTTFPISTESYKNIENIKIQKLPQFYKNKENKNNKFFDEGNKYSILSDLDEEKQEKILKKYDKKNKGKEIFIEDKCKNVICDEKGFNFSFFKLIFKNFKLIDFALKSKFIYLVTIATIKLTVYFKVVRGN
jgi:hypothetical protein